MDAAAPAPARPKRRTKLTKPDRFRTQILTGLEQGQSQRSLAKKYGMSHSLISAWLDTLDQEKQELGRYRSSRVDALSQIQSKALTLQAKLLDGLLQDGLPNEVTLSQKAGLMQSLNIIIGTSYDKERLESGQSTANHSIVSRMIDSAVQDIYKPLNKSTVRSNAPQEGAGTAPTPALEAAPALAQEIEGQAGGGQGGEVQSVHVIASCAADFPEKISQ